jgi:hypothetical protein
MKATGKTLLCTFGTVLMALSQAAGADVEPAKTTHPLEGSWRWNFSMPDGTTTRPKLILALENGRLTGTTTFRAGAETPITNVVLKGDQLRFQVIRERDGREIVTTYSGKWNDKSIKGKVESNWAGEKQSYPWEAQRAHHGVEGVWKWLVTFRRGGRPFEMRVDLEQEGETLTGSMPSGRGRRRTEIQNGSFKNGELYFEVERDFGGVKILTKYRGKQTGDTIKGTTESTTFDGEERKDDWEARRSD